jgi:hypothetical protein
MEKYKIRIILDSNGEKIGDLDCFSWVEQKLQRIEGTGQEIEIRIANVLPLHAFRVLVKEGRIPFKNILVYNLLTDEELKRPIRIDKNGTLESYPKGLLAIYGDVFLKLM